MKRRKKRTRTGTSTIAGPPLSYADFVDGLAPLESFDARAFDADDLHSDGLCNLVLALALAYNDLRDLGMALHLMNGVPQPPIAITTERGQYSAVAVHLQRLLASHVNELLMLIHDQRAIVESPEFGNLTKQLSARSRNAWTGVVDAALNRSTSGAIGKTLTRIRNKIGYHYDPDELARGFRSVFGGGESCPVPLVSRGGQMISSRFYFADAAALEYMKHVANGEEARAFLEWRSPLPQHVNLALYELVTRFIQLRGFAWRASIRAE